MDPNDTEQSFPAPNPSNDLSPGVSMSSNIPPASVTEDGYLGDCSSDGGNEKNFPIPPDRLKRFSGGNNCRCHPREENTSDDGNTLASGSGIDPPAGLAFKNIKPSDLLSSCGYQVLLTTNGSTDANVPPGRYTSKGVSGASSHHHHHHHHSRKMRSSLRSRIFNHSSWSSMKASIAERKIRIHAGTNNNEQVERLLANGANPNAADEHGRTALHIAAAKGYAEVVNTMLRSGAEPNQKDSLGNTPLHLAACTNHIEVVTLLLRAGTNVETLDNNGRTPMQLAQSKLKLLQKNPGSKEMGRVKTEVAQVVEMMVEYLSKTGHQTSAYSELLNSFSHRLNLHQTHDDINSDLQNLLESLGNLSLQKGPDNNEPAAAAAGVP